MTAEINLFPVFAQALSVSDEADVIVIPSSRNLGQWAGLLCLRPLQVKSSFCMSFNSIGVL